MDSTALVNLPIMVGCVNVLYARAKLHAKMVLHVRISLPESLNVSVHLDSQDLIAQSASQILLDIAALPNVSTEEPALNDRMAMTASVLRSSPDRIVKLTNVPTVTLTRTVFMDAVAAGKVTLVPDTSALKLIKIQGVVFARLIIIVFVECASVFLDFLVKTLTVACVLFITIVYREGAFVFQDLFVERTYFSYKI